MFKAFGSGSSLEFSRQRRSGLHSASSGSRCHRRDHELGRDTPLGPCHVVTLSFWCHATCQSLSTELRGQHLPAFTPAPETRRRSCRREEHERSGGTVNYSHRSDDYSYMKRSRDTVCGHVQTLCCCLQHVGAGNSRGDVTRGSKDL